MVTKYDSKDGKDLKESKDSKDKISGAIEVIKSKSIK